MEIIRWPRLLIVAGVMFTASAGPAGATASHPGGIVDTCPEILRGRPTGNLEKATLPADGSTVRAGQPVAVTLRWDQGDFSGAQLHKALDCVTVNGEVSEALSVQSRDPANDGTFEHSFVVPADLEPGSRLCDRGFVSGPGSVGDFAGHKSNDVCFDVAAPSEGPPGSTPVAAPDTTPGPTPPPVTGSRPPAAPSSPEAPTPDIAAPVVPPDTAHSMPPAQPVPTELRPEQPRIGVRPGVAGKPAIPATGRTEQPFLLASGAALALGGLAVAGSARRRQPVR
ncbi:MAG: hypothetical protein QOE80_3289 [Actinomycetota bacterium]|jgi:hypothetical protein|nr:hypothetical protein [Actinomycetota bacterium]